MPPSVTGCARCSRVRAGYHAHPPPHGTGATTYNGAVALRVGIDARKLTDFGIGTYLEGLVSRLAVRRDLELLLLVREEHAGRARRLAPDATIRPVSAGGYTARELYEIGLAFRGHGLDVIHIPHYVIPAWLPAPAVVTVHDIIHLLYPPRDRRPGALLYVRHMMRRTLRRARRVVTVSRTTRNDLVSIFGGRADRIDVIPNGVDGAFFERPPRETLERLRERYGLRPPLVLVVANDKPHKNAVTALRAFHRAVRIHGIPGQLVFVGGFPPDGPLAVTARRMGLGGRVVFTGRVPREDLLGLYHIASVLLHVALYEGFGLPILEGMAAGVPVITSNLGAMRELGEGPARLVEPLDVFGIAETIERVLVDDPLRRRMIEAGRKRARELSWERAAEAMVAVFRKAAGRAAGEG